MTNVGRLLASGRDGDIFEFGPGLVLRKAKNGRVIEDEARTITYAREHGYPVPEIHDVRANGTEIVMERIVGPMMLDVMTKKPWRMRRYAHELADLHDRLHEIPAPEWLPALDDGDRFLHLDLHPMNVMLTANGPVVIDWPNAARGDALSDVAVTFVLLTCPEMPGSRIVNRVVHPLRVALARTFASRYEGAALDAKLVLAAQLKALDRNLTPGEVAACERLEAKARARLA
jgi:tRNA A-37 threonylcarbamoyl transferase component Bud32